MAAATVITEVSRKRVPGENLHISFDIVLGAAISTFTLNEAIEISSPAGAEWTVYTSAANRGEVYWNDTTKLFMGQDFTNGSTFSLEVFGQ